jgi:hypothetical protein
MLATAVTLLWAPAALAQETTTETTTTTNQTATTAPVQQTAPSRDPWAETARTRDLRRRALRLRVVARRFSRLTRSPVPHLHPTRSDFDSLLVFRRWVRRAWFVRAARTRYRAKHPPHVAAWLCIHRWEGSWHDPDAPYYGGLQMDLAFQRTYGLRLLRRKGTADHWAPFEQMWIAEHAVRAGRGFYPWPLTARRCGLI